MLTKPEFLALIEREVAIISHLVAKLQPEHLSFRFTPPQRTTQELIEFLAAYLVGGVSYFVNGNWNAWEGSAKQAAGVTPAAFPTVVAAQIAEVRRLLGTVPDAEFATRPSKSAMGQPMPLPEALLTGTVGWTYAYKMQLFLQAKAAGIADIGTSNLWGGIDRAAQA